MKRAKKYVAAASKVDSSKLYTIEEAVKLVKETSTVKFDATIDVSFRLGVDPKQADQQVRGTLILPHGNGKTKKVLAITDKVDDALAAGADFAGGAEMVDKIQFSRRADRLPDPRETRLDGRRADFLRDRELSL